MTLTRYRLVQPYGRHPHEHTMLAEFGTVAEAFQALDAMVAQMVKTGAPSDSIEAFVVDHLDRRVDRPGAH